MSDTTAMVDTQPVPSHIEGESCRSVFDQAGDAILLHDPATGKIVDFNTAACRMFGRSAQELIGSPVDVFCGTEPPYTPEDAMPWIQRAAQGNPQLFEWICQDASGRRFWVEIHVSLCRLEGRSYLLAIVRDITERKRGQEQLGRIRAALEDATDAIVIMDAGGEVVYANRGFERLTGYTAQTIGDVGVISLFTDSELIRRVFRTALNWGSWNGEIEISNREGKIIPTLARATPILDERMPTVGILFIINDISERKRLEAQLLQARKLESIGQLAAGVAHEINTPTQYIGDNLRFLQDSYATMSKLLLEYGRMLSVARESGLSPELLSEVNAAVEQADVSYLTQEVPLAVQQALEGIGRVADIVRAMKEFSHPGITDKVQIDINHAIENTVTVAQNAWKYVADLETDFDPDLPAVFCHPGEINQAFLNLLINATDAIAEKNSASKTGQKGKITIRTRQDGSFVEIRVCDTGGGIPVEIQPKVFDLFFTTKPPGKGTGQGLAIVHSIVVEKHGGTVRFESEPGQGTTFIVRLPLPQNAVRPSEEVADAV